MINRVIIRNFKRFAEQSFDLEDAMILAGPNNSGKSTLLQAIATWKFGLDRWMIQNRGKDRHYGVAITRSDFTAVPLREMNLLWEGRKVIATDDKPRRRLIEIILKGGSGDTSWDCGLEFEYDGPEQVYVRPLNLKNLEKEDRQAFPPVAVRNMGVVHVPPLSGIARDEQRYERGMQDLLIGQGRPGEILRNLLWEIAQEKSGHWKLLVEHIKHLFGIQLRKPSYSSAQPFIICEYRDPSYPRWLDLSNAGSGTLQALMLLAFLYARPATIFLLDEPDAHQHVILQEQIYELIRKVARERQGQVIVATHSEVILDTTEPTRVLGFFEKEPRLLTSETERDMLREAHRRVTTTDLLLGREVGAILYVEGETDGKILSEWARILDHPTQEFFKRPFVHRLGGRNMKEAGNHFFALRAACSNIRGLCLLDGDNQDEPDEETKKSGLVVLRWRRYEIENYLMQPETIKRQAPLWGPDVEEEFWRQVPRGTDLFGDHVSLVRVKASEEFLVPLFEKIKISTPKRDLYLLAAAMQPEEIHPEVKEKLDRIEEVLCRGIKAGYVSTNGQHPAGG